MALGNNYDNNKQQVKRPTVHSAYSFANPMSPVDPTKLSASYWNKMLKLTITCRAITSNENEISWDKDQNISVHLTHIKAGIFANEIRNFMIDPIAYNGSGVLSNETLVTISNGSEFGVSGTFLVIRKVKLETMETVSSFSYEFNSHFHHAIRNYSEETANFDKSFDDYTMLEVQQLLGLLDNYVAAVTNAVAYTVVDQLDYKMNRTDDLIKSCASALGVRTDGGSGASNNRRVKPNNSSFGGENNQPSTKKMSLEDAEEDLFG